MTGLDVLACIRVANMPEPKVASHRGRCLRCRMQVWVALSSPPAGQFWCTECAFDEIVMQEGVEIAPPTAKQVADLKRARRRGKQ